MYVCVCLCETRTKDERLFLSTDHPLPFKGLSIIGELIPPPPWPKARQAISDDGAAAAASTEAALAEVGDLLPWDARTKAS